MDQANNDKSLLFAVVSEEEAKAVPYPYVYVNDDITVRELHPSERSHLETPFHPADGARPYIKSSFDKKDGWGSISGFCLRSNIPSNIEILEPPLEDPTKASKTMFLEKQIKLAKEKGFEVIENADGTITMRRKPKS